MTKTSLDFAQEMAQECISKAPVIILGSGASAAYGIPGMPALRERLLATPVPADATDVDASAWGKFKDHLKTVDLETALTEFRLSEAMTRYVVITTWEFLSPSDSLVFDRLLEDRTLFPLTRLYKHLFASIHTSIDVVTEVAPLSRTDYCSVKGAKDESKTRGVYAPISPADGRVGRHWTQAQRAC